MHPDTPYSRSPLSCCCLVLDALTCCLLQGATYPQSLLLGDVAVQLELSHQEGRVSHTASGKQGHSGGLTLVRRAGAGRG